jgi:hypothetical protein
MKRCLVVPKNVATADVNMVIRRMYLFSVNFAEYGYVQSVFVKGNDTILEQGKSVRLDIKFAINVMTNF